MFMLGEPKKGRKRQFSALFSPIFLAKRTIYSSSIRMSRIWQAALATGVPGPKMAATPAL